MLQNVNFANFWEMITWLQSIYVILIYGTAQFKLQARVFLARVHFAARHEYFSKSCVRVGNCTEMLRAIHALVPFPFCTRSKMRTYVHALVPFPFCTHSFRSLFTCVQNVDALLHVIIPKLTRQLPRVQTGPTRTL